MCTRKVKHQRVFFLGSRNRCKVYACNVWKKNIFLHFRSQANIANYMISLVIQTSLCRYIWNQITKEPGSIESTQTYSETFVQIRLLHKTITNISSMKLTWHSSTLKNAMQKPTVFISITIISETMQVPGSVSTICDFHQLRLSFKSSAKRPKAFCACSEKVHSTKQGGSKRWSAGWWCNKHKLICIYNICTWNT